MTGSSTQSTLLMQDFDVDPMLDERATRAHGLGGKQVWAIAVLAALFLTPSTSASAADAIDNQENAELPVIGVSAAAVERQSGVQLPARVDTGAASCALHVEDFVIDDEAESMDENVGKSIKIKIVDERGESHWIESSVADVAKVKNPSTRKRQRRYKVWLDLAVDEVAGRVKVAITDRGHMRFPLLLGRNFLAGRFLIDPSLDGA